jgi:hypothetical protein
MSNCPVFDVEPKQRKLIESLANTLDKKDLVNLDQFIENHIDKSEFNTISKDQKLSETHLKHLPLN